MLKVGLLGAGRISRRHYEALQELQGLGIAQVGAVCDTDFERTEGFGSAERFGKLPEMLAARPDLDLISVLTPSGNHHEHALETMSAGFPTLVEKPFTLSFEKAKELVRISEDQNLPLFVVKQNRLNDSIIQLLSSIESGELGEICFAAANVLWSRDHNYYTAEPWRLSRSSDGGVVWNQASHYVDLLVQVLGPFETVFAHGANFLSPADTEDTVFATIKSRAGSIGSLNATTTIRPSNYEGSLTVSGTKGLWKVGGHALNKVIVLDSEPVVNNDYSTHSLDVYGKSHSRVYAEVFADISGVTTSQFRASGALDTMRALEAISISVQEQRLVHADEVG